MWAISLKNLGHFRLKRIRFEFFQLPFSSTTTHDDLLKNRAFIDGRWVLASSGLSFDVKNPFDGLVIGTVPNMDHRDMDNAIGAAVKAFPAWRDKTAKERSVILRRWYDLCCENLENLSRILTLEQGKPLLESRAEVTYGNSFLEWFAEEGRRLYGEVAQSPVKNKQMIFVREPIGVAGLITPWNFPNAMITRKVGAALASGCTCVLKPAEDTPLSALALASLAEEAGLPSGTFNVVTSDRDNAAVVGQAMCESPHVKALSFTGSTTVGKFLYRQCAGTIKKISLELGGNAPFIVFDSANVELAVLGCMASKFRNAGQTCVSSNRIFVQDSVYDAFLSKLQSMLEKGSMVMGDGLKEETALGPIINETQFNRISHMVEDAVKNGATMVTGGANGQSLFYSPTILTGVTKEMKCFKEEIFGPVLSIVKFFTEEEVINLANDSHTGLAGYFYSNDVSQCWRVAKSLEVGMIGINEGMISAAEAPFGGIKESGIGREGSKFGMEEYTHIKYLCFGNT